MDKNKIKEALRPVVKDILNEVDDPTEYKLELGDGIRFVMSKKGKMAVVANDKTKDYVGIPLDKFQKIVNFAKKNGGIK